MRLSWGETQEAALKHPPPPHFLVHPKSSATKAERALSTPQGKTPFCRAQEGRKRNSRRQKIYADYFSRLSSSHCTARAGDTARGNNSSQLPKNSPRSIIFLSFSGKQQKPGNAKLYLEARLFCNMLSFFNISPHHPTASILAVDQPFSLVGSSYIRACFGALRRKWARGKPRLSLPLVRRAGGAAQ